MPRAQRASAGVTAFPGIVTAPTGPAQLALELPAELPRLAIAPEWKDQQRLWGHSFHPMCRYLAMLPGRPRPCLHRPLHAARRRRPRPASAAAARRPLQACAEGRLGVGIDLNPMAALLTAAKVEPPTRPRPAPAWPAPPALPERTAGLAGPGRRGPRRTRPRRGAGARGGWRRSDRGPAAARGGPGLPSPDASAELLFLRHELQLGRAGSTGSTAGRGRAGYPPWPARPTCPS